MSFRMRFRGVRLAASCAMLAACGSAAPASSSGDASADVARYQGADRQQVLEAGARKEGSVNWYTVMAGDAVEAVSSGFKQKYPYLQVDIFRADAGEVVTRATQEAQAGKHVFDVVDMSSPQIDLIGEAKLFTPYFSPSIASFAPELKFGVSGPLVVSASDWTTIIGFGYNTQLIPESAVPKTQADLLNPALAGKMTLAGTTTGYNWVGSILKAMGEDNGRKFLDQILRDHFYTTGGEKLPYQIWLPGEGKAATDAAKEAQSWADLFKADFR